MEWGGEAGEVHEPDGTGPCRSNSDMISCYTKNGLGQGAVGAPGWGYCSCQAAGEVYCVLLCAWSCEEALEISLVPAPWEEQKTTETCESKSYREP